MLSTSGAGRERVRKIADRRRIDVSSSERIPAALRINLPDPVQHGAGEAGARLIEGGVLEQVLMAGRCRASGRIRRERQPPGAGIDGKRAWRGP